MAQGNEESLLSISDTLLPIARAEWTSLSAPERVFALVWTVEAEINNGCFNQFYFNSAGDHAADSPSALREIGAVKMAVLVDSANSLFPDSGPPVDRDSRQEVLEEIDDEMEDQMEGL